MSYLELAKAAQARRQAAKEGGASPAPTPPPPIPEALRLPAAAPETPIPDLITEYKAVLARLYELGALGPDADPAECRRLVSEQQRLHDDLGPEFAHAVDRQYSRVWAAQTQRCPSCGAEGIFQNPDTGEAIPIDIDTILKWTAPGTPAPPGLEAARGWPDALPDLGPRRPGPYTPCWTCNAGTFAFYGETPLCQRCARTRGGPSE